MVRDGQLVEEDEVSPLNESSIFSDGGALNEPEGNESGNEKTL